eukprot:6191744-Pleurochrysis_carterae.AAC.1
MGICKLQKKGHLGHNQEQAIASGLQYTCKINSVLHERGKARECAICSSRVPTKVRHAKMSTEAKILRQSNEALSGNIYAKRGICLGRWRCGRCELEAAAVGEMEARPRFLPTTSSLLDLVSDPLPSDSPSSSPTLLSSCLSFFSYYFNSLISVLPTFLVVQPMLIECCSCSGV